MILIVEDDAGIRELEEYALQSNGFDARGCEDAAIEKHEGYGSIQPEKEIQR